jgi:hexosaminidase
VAQGRLHGPVGRGTRPPGRDGTGVLRLPGLGALGRQERAARAAKAEYMYFPRLCAFAEVVWSQPGGDLAEFEERLTRHLPRLDACYVNYRPLT